MLAIKNNIMASNAARHLGKSYDNLSQSVERLSSGLRINGAKDDAAGLAVRELMRADTAVVNQGSRNAQDGISMLQTMEGAMAVIDENLIRMQELAEQASTGSYSAGQRQIMNSEFSEMADEIERIAGSTTFNDINLLNSPTGSVDIHVGTDDTISIDKTDMTKSGLGIETGSAGFELRSETGVAAADSGAFLTAGGADGGTVTLDIQFTDGDGDNEDAISVDFASSAAGTDYTLQEVVDAINAKTQNLGNDADGNSKDYSMASTVYDSSSNKHYLKLGSRNTAMDGATMTATTDATAVTVGSAFNVSSGDTSNHSVTEDDDGWPEGDQKMEKMAGTGVNILTASDAQDALDTVEAAISTKDASRASFGYKMNRLESTTSILDIQAENLMSAESRISDVDVATEMAKMTRNQVLAQAGISMLSQANQMPQMAMSLLQ